MNTSKRALLLSCVCALLSGTFVCPALDWPQWRGPNRDGTSAEKGLLKEWPSGGPKLVWKINDAGSGYSTPSVVGDTIYLLGNEGLENEFVAALKVADGKRLWATRIGNVGNPKQDPNFPAARSTPTVQNDAIYALGSDGDIVRLSPDGKVVWQKNLRTELKGKIGTWAYAESPLVDGDRVICTPGGGEATIIALNKNTGEVIWKCAVPEADEAAYASAIPVTIGGTKEYVQLLQKGLVGVDADTGKLLWRYGKAVSPYNANIPSPLASGDIVYVASAGAGGGAVRIKPGSETPEQLYFSPKMPTAIGGAVKVGSHLYGTTAQAMLCLDFGTGEVKWEDRALGAAALCYVDDRLYLHSEKGEVALVEATAEGYREKGRFTPPDAPARKNNMEKPWAYPIVSNGKLYIRDHASLWCYDVKAR